MAAPANVTDEIRSIVGPKGVVAPEDWAPYVREWRQRWNGRPAMVVAPADARAVPRAAVSRLAEQAYMFVARDTRFLWTPVEVLGESGAQSVVRGPLEPDARVVVSGIAALKAQLAD